MPSLVTTRCPARRSSSLRWREGSTPTSRILAMPGADDNIERAFRRGLELARRGDYFAAHEAFELAWRVAAADERDFFQGLVHAVVFAYQSGRGRPVGAERQRLKARRRLGPYGPR